MDEPDVARVAGLLADPARARILRTLIDGSMRPAGELAFAAKHLGAIGERASRQARGGRPARAASMRRSRAVSITPRGSQALARLCS